MCHRKQRLESHTSESESEFLEYLDDRVPDSVLEGQDVPEKEPDDRKQDKKNEKTKKAKKPSTPDLVKDKNDKNSNSNKRGREDSSPTKEPASPPKKMGRAPKLTTKTPAVPTLPTFRTTRSLNAVKYVNRSTRKQIPKDIHKTNRVCIDCKTTEMEECLLCGKEQHISDMGVEMKIQADYEWLWVCLECLDIATDDSAMINVRELVDKEKKKKETETYTCNICTCIINSDLQGSIQCTQCSD